MSIQTNITLKDGVSPALQSMNRALNIVLNTLQSVSAGFQRPIDVAAFNTARNELARAAIHIENIEAGTNEAVVAQQQLVQAANNVANAERSVTEEIKQANAQQQKFNADNQNIVSVIQRIDTGFESVVTELKNITYFVAGIVPGLHKIREGVNDIKNGQNQTVNAIQSGNRELQKTATSIYRANINQLRLTSSFKQGVLDQLRLKNVTQQIKPAIDQNGRSQQRFNEYVRSGVNESTRFLSNIRSALGAYMGFHSVKGIINTADTLVTTTARLDLINDGLQTTKQLQQKIYESAMNSRAGYAETADVVAKLATRAGKVFSSNDETVAFANTLQKMFHIAGASTQEMNSASLQLVQALGSGVLRGEELNAVFEAAPNVIQAIADYMNKPIGQIREMAKKGEITAGIVKNAMFAAADDVNKKFASMPMTWAQAWTVFKNFALKTFEPLLQRISAITASERFKGFANGLGKAISRIAEVAIIAFDKISNGIAYIHDNWKRLKPIILGVAAGILAFNFALTTTKIVLAAYNLMLGVMEAKKKLAAGATFLMTSQQVGLNMALLACPWTWVVGGIIALIAVIGVVIATTTDWEAANIDVWATMKNVFSEIGTFLREHVISAFNRLKEIAAEVKSVLLDLGEAIINNWSVISPIIWGAVTALGAYAMWQGIVTVATAIYGGVVAVVSAIKTIAATISTFYRGCTLKEAAALTWLAAAEWAANLPLIAKIALIGIIIALIAWLIAKIAEWCGVTLSVTGIIAGAFAWLAATVWNIIVGVWNGLLSFLDYFVDYALGIIEWFINAFNGGFNSFGDACANLIGQICSWFLSLGQIVTTIIDAIFGTNWTAGLESLKSSVLSWGKNEDAITLERGYLRKNLGAGRVSATDWYNAGYKFGEKTENWVKNLSSKDFSLDSLTNKLGDLVVTKDSGYGSGISVDDPAGDLAKALGGGYNNPALDKIAGNTDDIAKNTGATADNTASQDEDLKYMRRLAEREAMNRYQLTDLKVEMTNNNSISSNVDADKVMMGIVKQITHAAKTNAESAFSFVF